MRRGEAEEKKKQRIRRKALVVEEKIRERGGSMRKG